MKCGGMGFVEGVKADEVVVREGSGVMDLVEYGVAVMNEIMMMVVIKWWFRVERSEGIEESREEVR